MLKRYQIFIYVMAVFCFLPLFSEETFKVGIYQNDPKVFIDRSGRPSGIFVDILNEIAKMSGWKIDYIPGKWPDQFRRAISTRI